MLNHSSTTLAYVVYLLYFNIIIIVSRTPLRGENIKNRGEKRVIYSFVARKSLVFTL